MGEQLSLKPARPDESEVMTMFAEVRTFSWPDLVSDAVEPALPTLLEMFVTSPGRTEMLRYEIAVTTVEELAARLESQPCIAGHGQVIIRKFDRKVVESHLRSAVARVSANSWPELDLALQRLGRSELDMDPNYWSPDPWSD